MWVYSRPKELNCYNGCNPATYYPFLSSFSNSIYKFSSESLKDRKGKQAPVDFMVDNLKEARDKYAKIGLKPTPINKGKVHSSFYIPGPSGWVFKITSTHVTNLPV